MTARTMTEVEAQIARAAGWVQPDPHAAHERERTPDPAPTAAPEEEASGLYILAEREHHAHNERCIRLTTYSDGTATLAVENTDGMELRQMCAELDRYGLLRLAQMVDHALRDVSDGSDSDG